MKTKPVAAVCDRRWERAPALIERRYSANESVVAAVCDRRWNNQMTAVIDSRYNFLFLQK